MQENPVHLLHLILALQLPTRTNEGRVHLKVTPGRKSEVHTTAGDINGRNVTTLPVSSVKALDRRALAFDALVEASRVSYESGRAREINKDAYRFCIEFGHSHDTIQQRHDEHLCYFCGDNVRAASGLLHTFWDCPGKLDVDDRIQQQLRDKDLAEGASGERSLNTQRLANDRRGARDGSARQDADQDTTFARGTPRNQGPQRWSI